MNILALLGGEEHIDFWMSDRSEDGDVCLDNLSIEEKRRLKCSAHPNLAVDSAIDSMLKDVEKTIGRDQLTSLNLGNFQSDSTVATLGFIAIAKSLSPSHIALTYPDYKD